MTKKVLLHFTLLLWFIVPVTAQLTIFVESAEVVADEQFFLDVKVSNFTDIVGMQFSVNWDEALLRVDSIDSKLMNGLPEYGLANFNINNFATGYLTTAWTDPALSGYTLTDSSSIFRIYLTALASAGLPSSIDISGTPTQIELTDLNGNVLTVNAESGTVIVLNPTSAFDLKARTNQSFALHQNEPNPFDNQTNIIFDVYEASNYVLEVCDTKGKIVHSERAYYTSGNHTIVLKKDRFPTAGIYFYTLKTKDIFITNRMILVR